MIRGRAWLAALACLTSVTACSSAGTPVGSAQSATAGTGSSPGRLGSAYSVRIGPYTQVYSSPVPANAAQAAVIAGFRTAQVLWGRSNEAFRLVPPVSAYVTGEARVHMEAAVAYEKQYDYVPAGIERFFDTKVAQLGSTTATITTCDDSSRYRTRSLSTGTDLPRAPANQLYLAETWDMVRLSGHWAIANFTLSTLPDKSAAACQP